MEILLLTISLTALTLSIFSLVAKNFKGTFVLLKHARKEVTAQEAIEELRKLADGNSAFILRQESAYEKSGVRKIFEVSEAELPNFDLKNALKNDEQGEAIRKDNIHVRCLCIRSLFWWANLTSEERKQKFFSKQVMRVHKSVVEFPGFNLHRLTFGLSQGSRHIIEWMD